MAPFEARQSFCNVFYSHTQSIRAEFGLGKLDRYSLGMQFDLHPAIRVCRKSGGAQPRWQDQTY